MAVLPGNVGTHVGWKLAQHRDAQLLLLRHQVVEERPLRALWIHHLGLIPEVVEMPRSDQAVAAVVTGAADEQHSAR